VMDIMQLDGASRRRELFRLTTEQLAALLQKDIAVVMCQKLTLRAMWARPSRKDLVMLRLAVMLRLRSVWPEAPRDKGLSTARAEQIEEPAPLTPH
ncbi:manF, partial [Symbiodinium sp. KB8]